MKFLRQIPPLLLGLLWVTVPAPAQVHHVPVEPAAIGAARPKLLLETSSPDDAYCLGIRTDVSRELSLALVQVEDGVILWESNPTGGSEDIFRYRLRAHGFRDMQYAWSDDSRCLALAAMTSRGGHVLVLQRGENGGFTLQTVPELSDAELFREHLPITRAGEENTPVPKLYMNLAFAGEHNLEVTTEGFIYQQGQEQKYYTATVRYDLRPGADPRITKVDLELSGLDE